ncbi:MAG: TlpA disulfide reductase family protein [Dysgonamonadaceae bacterium]
MNKLIYLITAMTIVFASCKPTTGYNLKGTITDTVYEGTMVYLQELTDSAIVNVDSAKVIDGAFTFKGNTDSTVVRIVSLDQQVNPQNRYIVPVVLESGKISLAFDSLITVKGTPLNDKYNSFREGDQRKITTKLDKFMNEFSTLRANGELTEEKNQELMIQYDLLINQYDSVNYIFTKENIQNPLGEFLFVSNGPSFSPEKQRELINLSSESLKAKPFVKDMIAYLDNYEKVAIGKTFADFSSKDVAGNDVSLSDYAGKGKYVLVDFWAAWCGPCRREMPNVVNAYKKYKNKGFEVVGVSLDQSKEDWVKGLKELNMTWPQMSDLKYWDSEVVNLYAIKGIPHTILLDKDGTIIAKDLSGAALDSKLAELMP